MKKFIIVLHQWHVSSNGFKYEEIQANGIIEAHNKAVLLEAKYRTTFNATGSVVIPIEDRETSEISKIPKLIRLLFGCKI